MKLALAYADDVKLHVDLGQISAFSLGCSIYSLGLFLAVYKVFSLVLLDVFQSTL